MARIVMDPETTAVGFQPRYLRSPLKWNRADERNAWEDREAPDGTACDAVRRLVSTLLPYVAPPTLPQIARMMGLQERALQRLLSAEGRTFLEILNAVRHTTALDLLATTEAPVKEIAHHLGYSSSSNFVRAFTKYAGISPSQSRQQKHK